MKFCCFLIVHYCECTIQVYNVRPCPGVLQFLQAPLLRGRCGFHQQILWWVWFTDIVYMYSCIIMHLVFNIPILTHIHLCISIQHYHICTLRLLTFYSNSITHLSIIEYVHPYTCLLFNIFILADCLVRDHPLASYSNCIMHPSIFEYFHPYAFLSFNISILMHFHSCAF